MQRGTKPEVATSDVPSRGPRREPKCYVTAAFSGVPNAKPGENSEVAQEWAHRLPACIFGKIILPPARHLEERRGTTIFELPRL